MTYREGEFVPSDRAEMGESTLPFELFLSCWNLKLLPIHFDLCVDVTGVVCHQLGLLGTNLLALGCGGFVKTLN